MESSSGRDGQLLRFFLCEPGKYMTEITARPCDTCEILARLFPTQRMVFIFKGVVLTPAVPLSSYGIALNDIVIGLVDPGVSLGEVRDWVQLTKRDDAFDDMIRSVMNAATNSEAMRLRDLMLMRAEMRPRQIRRVVKSPTEERPPAETSDVSTKSVIGKVPTELSTAQLPTMWK
jgi:hypothetical protein